MNIKTNVLMKYLREKHKNKTCAPQWHLDQQWTTCDGDPLRLSLKDVVTLLVCVSTHYDFHSEIN